MNERPKPKILYKFRSWNNDYHKTLLTERKLWVPTATDLNDPFDCCIPLRIDRLPEKTLRKKLESLLSPEMPSAQRKEHARARIRNLGFHDEARRRKFLEESAQFYRSEHGILSFSTVKDIPLLWSHYADSYKGFCVRINVTPFSSVVEEFLLNTGKACPGARVTYVKTFPEIVPSEDMDDDVDNDKFLQLFTTKSKHWEYEEEYRYVFMGAGGFPLILTPQCVSEVILGSEMPEAHKDEVTKVARQQFPSATVLRAERKFDSFELEFIPL